MTTGSSGGRVRTKDPLENIESILKRERRERRRLRRREERKRREDGITDDTMSPPRASKSEGISTDDPGYVESNLSPNHARKRETHFYERLRCACEEDAGVEYYEELLYCQQPAASFSYGGAAEVAMGLINEEGKQRVDHMDEEEYAEYVRAAMWRRRNKDEVERLQHLEREKKQREERIHAQRIKDDKEEKRRVKLLEDQIKKRSEQEAKDSRQRYDDMWKKLTMMPLNPGTRTPVPADLTSAAPSVDTSSDQKDTGPFLSIPQSHPLRFTDFPWPVYPPVPFPPLSWPTAPDITPASISSFLLGHSPAHSKKAVLRSAVLAYHPDRFDRLLARIPTDNAAVRERVKELGLRVSQILNGLMSADGS